MKLLHWLFSRLHRRKKVYFVQIPVGFQLPEHIRLALFGEPVLFSKKVKHE